MGIDAEMFVLLNRSIENDELKRKSYIFGSIFKGHLWLGDYYKNPLELVNKIEGDGYGEGYEFHSDKNISLIKVPLVCRYYGISYERGPIGILAAMADFLERLFTDGKIYYGGDSSGIRFIEFNKVERDKLLNHAALFAHDPYNKHFSGNHSKYVCPNCKQGMTQNGWKGKLGYFSCTGCGWHISEKSETEIEQGFEVKF